MVFPVAGEAVLHPHHLLRPSSLFPGRDVPFIRRVGRPISARRAAGRRRALVTFTSMQPPPSLAQDGASLAERPQSILFGKRRQEFVAGAALSPPRSRILRRDACLLVPLVLY